MIKKFTRGWLKGMSIVLCSVGVCFLFVSGLELLDKFCEIHNLNFMLVSGIIWIFLGSCIYGVLAVKNKI